MSKVLKGLAIGVLLLTIAGACAVLYALNTFTPRVEQVTVTATPAAQAIEAFSQVKEQLESGTFAGRVYGNTSDLTADGYTFVTYTVRLQNRGFFPAEWISLAVMPTDGTEILALADTGKYVLAAGSRGDLSATILVKDEGQNTARELSVACYVFGRKVAFSASSS